jgi:A1 cistron-splicing factor AAR2
LSPPIGFFVESFENLNFFGSQERSRTFGWSVPLFNQKSREPRSFQIHFNFLHWKLKIAEESEEIMQEQIPQELAQKLFEQGAILILLDLPSHLQLDFGVDFNSWQTGPKFKGLKLIPPGLHYIHYSIQSKQQGQALSVAEQSLKSGFFHEFKSGELMVRKWNPDQEIFTEIYDQEELARFRCNILEFDQFLGPYPLVADPSTGNRNTYQEWLSLSKHISSTVLTKILPEGYCIYSMHMTSKFSDVPDERLKDVQPSTQTLHQERLHFTDFDLKKSFPQGAAGQELSNYARDKSWLLESLLSNYPATQSSSNHETSETFLLGELELSFVLFLVAQVFDGFEQWKALIHLFCYSKEALEMRGNTLFAPFAGGFCSWTSKGKLLLICTMTR